MKNRIITISREYGSGGREIGQKVADRLQIPFYDKEIITLAAEESGISPELMAGLEEQRSLFSGIDPTNFASPYTLEDRMFLAQSRVIKDLAAKGPCVIVGRAASHVLARRDDCLHLFIYADLDDRIKRVSRRLGIGAGEAEKKILRNDRARAAYFKHYTGKEWGSPHTYNLALDSGYLGAEATTNAICHRVQPEWHANKVQVCG